MDTTIKPAWLLEPSRLLEVTDYHLFMPANLPKFTSLPEESSLHSGIRQYLYWKGQLIPSLPQHSICLAFLGPEGLIRPNVMNVTKALSNVCDLSQVLEFHQGANTCFFSISFASPQPILDIQSHFKFFDNSIVLNFLSSSAQQHHFRLLWLPPRFDINRVHHLLNTISSSHRLRRESIAFHGNIFAPTNTLSGTITIESGTNISSLPHLIKLPAPHKGCALLIIENRPPLCLKCKAIGHTHPNCPLVKCRSCARVHFPDSPCGQSSYSTVAARNITNVAADDWMAGLPDCDITAAPPSTSDPDAPLADESIPLTNIPVPSTHHSIPTSPTTFSVPASSSHSSPVILDTAKCDRTTCVSAETAKSASASSDFSDTLSDNPLQHLRHSPPAPDAIPLHSSCEHLTSSQSIISPSQPDPLTTSKPLLDSFRPSKASKVFITDHAIPRSSIARSSYISYSAHHQNCLPPPYSTAPTDALSSSTDVFGDPISGACFSPDSVTSPTSDHSTSDQDMDCTTSTSRKRKTMTSHDLSPSISSADSPLSHDIPPDSDDFSDFSNTLDSDNTTAIIPQLSSLQSTVASLFSADHDRVLHLESLCPGGVFTNDLIKIFKLLAEQGIHFLDIINSPQILTLPLRELRNKIKYLNNKIGILTVGDIIQATNLQDHIENKLKITPSTFFY